MRERGREREREREREYSQTIGQTENRDRRENLSIQAEAFRAA